MKAHEPSYDRAQFGPNIIRFTVSPSVWLSTQTIREYPMRQVQYQVLWQFEKQYLLHRLIFCPTLVLDRYEYFLDDCIDRDHLDYGIFKFIACFSRAFSVLICVTSLFAYLVHALKG